MYGLKKRIQQTFQLSLKFCERLSLSLFHVVASRRPMRQLESVEEMTSAGQSRQFQQNHHHDSLAFQLNCVSGSCDSGVMSMSPTSDVGDVTKLAFPNLPATVSDSSCDKGLTRANLVRHVSSRENDTKESFGWFVDLDDHQSPEAQTGLPYVVSRTDLAFQAPTAPKRVNDDAEVEWAKAADTVDDVLGDFF